MQAATLRAEEAAGCKRQLIQTETEDVNPEKRCRVLCCNCGEPMDANPTSMCANCVKNQVDITGHLCRSVVLPHCKECNRYMGDSRWLHAELESKELLSVCLKKIKGTIRF